MIAHFAGRSFFTSCLISIKLGMTIPVTKGMTLILLCQLTVYWARWILTFAGMTANMGRVIGVIPAKAGIHFFGTSDRPEPVGGHS
jgi:hypothetical protein